MIDPKMIDPKKKLLQKYLGDHNQNISKSVLSLLGAFLGLSIIWNSIFLLFDLAYSRANLSLLILCFILLTLTLVTLRLISIPYSMKKHVVLILLLIIFTGLYFGSGYRESWSFFLILPIITGLYGDRIFLFLYSSIGAVLLIITSIWFPVHSFPYDSIDISNRVLIYIAISSLSYLLLKNLFDLHKKQVTTIVESAENTLEQIVNSFIIAIEAKDTYTFGHSERVSKYAVELAKQLPEFQSENKLKRFRLTGLLHDIGKINIPEQILTKPARLTEEEFAVIKTHTTQGALMIEKIDGIANLKHGALYHHERWDGKGYPTQLKGEDIPLEARVLAVADAFDAMTSSRAYRDALPIHEAFKRIEEGKGTQFDPELVEILAGIKLKWTKIYKESHNPVDEFEKVTDFL